MRQIQFGNGRIDDSSRRKSRHITDTLTESGGCHGTQPKGDSNGHVNGFSRLDHDEVIHKAKAYHGNSRSESNDP